MLPAAFFSVSFAFTPTLCGEIPGFVVCVSMEGTAMSGSRSMLRDSQGKVPPDWTDLFCQHRIIVLLFISNSNVNQKRTTNQRHLGGRDSQSREPCSRVSAPMRLFLLYTPPPALFRSQRGRMPRVSCRNNRELLFAHTV